MKSKNKLIHPILLPIYFFAILILFGTILLYLPFTRNSLASPIKLIDAFFISTSAACVTGLSSIDIGSNFNKIGHCIILALVQIGGLGIMTFASLLIYLLKRKTRLSDIIMVGQALRQDQSFSLGKFLVKLMLTVIMIETIGALILYFTGKMNFFASFFHSISAFCNAGFSIFPDNLISFQGDIIVNVVIMTLIILGGLGFAVLLEIGSKIKILLFRQKWKRFSWPVKIILQTTCFLIISGAVIFFISSLYLKDIPLQNRILLSFFQSVTARTAGFNTIDISIFSDYALVFLCFLMFIGGAPASTAGGIKVTTFRILLVHSISLIKWDEQAVLSGRAVNKESRQAALSLLFISLFIVFISVLMLCASEQHVTDNGIRDSIFLTILLEVNSAFGTVGLTADFTPNLSVFGKTIISCLMFIGRLGPLVLLTAFKEIQKPKLYTLPEDGLMVG